MDLAVLQNDWQGMARDATESLAVLRDTRLQDLADACRGLEESVASLSAEDRQTLASALRSDPVELDGLRHVLYATWCNLLVLRSAGRTNAFVEYGPSVHRLIDTQEIRDGHH